MVTDECKIAPVQQKGLYLCQLVKLVECTLKEMPDHVALHGRYIVQFDCNGALQRSQTHINFVKPFFSNVLQ